MKSNFSSMIDSTALKPENNCYDIFNIVHHSVSTGLRGVCIPPCYVKAARNCDKNIKISTVAGFPYGYSTCKTKAYEIEDALDNGADEIDLVWNIGKFLNNQYLQVVEELSFLQEKFTGILFKVIVEESLFNNVQLIHALRIIEDSGCWCIKTGTKDARIDTVKLWRKMNKDIIIKAAGGIKTMDQIKLFVDAGANIIGTSNAVELFQ